MSADSNIALPVLSSTRYGTIMRPERDTKSLRFALRLPTLCRTYGISSSHSASRARRQYGDVSNDHSSSGFSGATLYFARPPCPARHALETMLVSVVIGPSRSPIGSDPSPYVFAR
jgi:hypothetical protein